MTHPDRSQFTNMGERKFNLFLPQLTKPYTGVFNEISQECNLDPGRFVTIVKHKALLENPFLTACFDFVSKIPLPERANKWLSIYYEIFSRSASKAGSTLACFLDMNLAMTVARTEQLKTLMKSGDGWLGYINKEWADRKQRDSDFSDELGQFWKTIDVENAELERVGNPREDIGFSLSPLVFLQQLIQKQENQYRLSDQDLHK